MLFSEIIGHLELKNRLIQTVLNNRVSHAQLFLGQEGSESLALAIAYAQFISCTSKEMGEEEDELIADSCGKCPSCIKYQKLIHPDLNFVFPVATNKDVKSKPLSADFLPKWREALLSTKFYLDLNEWYSFLEIENKQGRIGVDDTMEIIKYANSTPFESRFNVIIIWMVEKLHHAAAPKLLKILEEPPANTFFFLISEDQEQILKTIQSRTQLVKLRRHPDNEMTEYIRSYFNLAGHELQMAVNNAEGNFKKVFSLVENNEIENFNFTNFRELMLFAYNNNLEKIILKVNTLSAIGRERLKLFFTYGLKVVRLCVLNESGSQKLVRSTGSELDFVSKFTKFVNSSNADKIADEITLAMKHIERNGNQKIVLMDFSLKMILIFRNLK